MKRSTLVLPAFVLCLCGACSFSVTGKCTDEQLAMLRAYEAGNLDVQAQPASAPTAQELSELEADFAKLLTGAKLVGSFTDDSKPDMKLQKDSYVISKAEKLESGQWRIEAVMEYGDKKVPVPVVLDVEWAGDTPVMTLDDYSIPMVGTYTARVLFLGERYVGIWFGADHGGHMLGRVERADAAVEAATPAKDDGKKK